MTDRVPLSCLGKRLYLDKPTADKMAKRTNNDRDAHVAPYHCNRCHGWHVGTTDRMPKRRRYLTDKQEDACQD